MIISVLNHKGGVGKTTTVHNLGAALANAGKTVLIVDFDPQCNLSNHCLTLKDVKGIGFAITQKTALEPINIKQNLDILPGSESLDELAMQWGSSPEKHTNHLSSVVKPFKDRYEYILVDSAPGSSMLMINAVFAAQELIIPISDLDSLQGAGKIARLLLRHKIAAKGHYLITRHDERTLISRDMYAAMTMKNKDAVFTTHIRSCEAIRQAAVRKMDIIAYSPKSNGAKDYIRLANEIIKSNMSSE